MKKLFIVFAAVAAMVFVGCTSPMSCDGTYNETSRALGSTGTLRETVIDAPDIDETQTFMGIEYRGGKYFVYAEKKRGWDSYIFAVVTDSENVNAAVDMQNMVASVIYRMSFEEFKKGCLTVAEKGYAADNGYTYYHREYKSRLFATAHAVVYPELCLGE